MKLEHRRTDVYRDARQVRRGLKSQMESCAYAKSHPSHPAELMRVKLSSTTTIGAYLRMAGCGGNTCLDGLASFIEGRLSERYILPVQAIPQTKRNGFLIMAAACLLIETLESFYRGWVTTKNPIPRAKISEPCKHADASKSVSASELAFCYFFQRETGFAAFRPVARDFYKGVRCGILHQGETTRGWRIRRDGLLFDKDTLTINACKFLAELDQSLKTYTSRLRHARWDEDIWENFRNKMNSIVVNCGRHYDE